MNNGHASPFFELKRGVRQGDPLSPYLFIIALELLAINIRNNKQIKGIHINGNEIKLVMFADDITAFPCDALSFSLLKDAIECFSNCTPVWKWIKKTPKSSLSVRYEIEP